MKRRDWMKSAAAAALAAGTGFARPQAGARPNWLVLEWYRSRNDMDTQRLRDYLSASLLPALNRAEIKPVGLFQTSVGSDSPSILLVLQFPTLAGIEEARRRMIEDKTWMSEMAAFDEKWELAYDRREAWLLEAFRGFPGIEVPKVESGKTNLFELRIYESRNTMGHLRKVSMFNDGEIDIFRRVGINPVFFGSTIFGPRSPNLVYMVAFPSWQAREEAWSKFRVDPDWRKMSAEPKYANRELVSTISSRLMTPLPASQIL